MLYKIDGSKGPRREKVEKWLFGLDLVSPKMRESIITAWVTSWTASKYERLEDIPWEPEIEGYPLHVHVNEVTRLGLKLNEFGAAAWGSKLDLEVLVPILILHDVDKPMMFMPKGKGNVRSPLYSEIPHGVVGGMLLNELGLATKIVSTVATHSPRMPFPGKTLEACILSYADLFVCDKVLLERNMQPFYAAISLPDFMKPLHLPDEE